MRAGSRTVLAILTVGLLAQQSSRFVLAAQNAGPVVKSYGPPNTSCGSVTAAVTAAASAGTDTYDTAIYFRWMHGFVSGAGAFAARQNIELRFTDHAGINAWLRKYCADHPLDDIHTAGIHLVDELSVRPLQR